jgi:class 3 adenylate cyclase
VLHRIADPAIPFSAGQKLAAEIPNCRFVPLAGKGHLFCLGDYSDILHAVDEFLGDRHDAARASTAVSLASRPARGSSVRTVLFTDLVGHTAMMQRLGDARGREVLREHERITRETLRAHGGTEIKTDGDSFMVSFGSVTSAVECAVALQRRFSAWNDERADPDKDGPEGASLRGAVLDVRMGLNAGEPIEEDGDLFGATVILASRIKEQAGAGEILIPETVRGLLSGKGFIFSDRGEFLPKGFEDGVRLFEVRWRE